MRRITIAGNNHPQYSTWIPRPMSTNAALDEYHQDKWQQELDAAWAKVKASLTADEYAKNWRAYDAKRKERP